MYQDNNNQIETLLRENQRLLVENNQLLRQMRRGTIIATIFRIVWFAFVIAVPVYLYFNYIEPNWENIQKQLENLETMTAKIDGANSWLEQLDIKTRP